MADNVKEIQEGIKDHPVQRPFLERFANGVVVKFIIFTVLMILIPIIEFKCFDDALGDIATLLICLLSVFIIMAIYVVMAFNEPTD